MRRWRRRTRRLAAPPPELTGGRWPDRSGARISIRTRAKQSGGKGGPYCGLLGLGETAGWAGDDGILPRLESTSEGAPPRSFNYYKVWNRIYVLLWCLLTWGTRLKGSTTMQRRASSSLEVAVGGKVVGEALHGSFYRGKHPGESQITFQSLSPR
jgi:hypothetical protein